MELYKTYLYQSLNEDKVVLNKHFDCVMATGNLEIKCKI